ncbi:metallophosphoesterase [Raineyella sp. LH-20]|uniref:metallophosphoesterase n=1 Tax=Raineyella sp. LH-20 TaxID=3081204 RepID=UPI002955208A|nr:metallophosphoesterase [Raineyella sp. LH-20]WOP19516.1 metallophosphoesterase [Raineyella sp. LH-20]
MSTHDYPEPKHFLLHLSDTHFVDGRGMLHDIVDSEANLREMFEGFDRANAHPEALIITGDIADRGDSDAYLRVRDVVESAAARYGSQVIWCMGNHDTRENFYADLLGEEASDEPYDRVFDLNGLRVVVLDSTVPGQHWGELTEAQLAWLGDVLATPAPDGTLLALHHPPVPSPLGLIRLFELHDQDRFAEVIRGTDVIGILGGHLHYSTTSTFAGVPVSVASATCYTQDLQVPYPAARGQAGGQSYNLVHVYEDRVLHSIVPIGDYPTAYAMDGEQLAAFLAKTPEEQLVAVNASVANEH